MRRLVLPVLFCFCAQPVSAAPLYECTSTQFYNWDDGQLQVASHLAERLASGELQFRLDPERGLEYMPVLDEDWADLFMPATVVPTAGIMGSPKAQFLAYTGSGSDSIRIVTEGDTLAFVWTTWGSVETGTCAIIESNTK